MPGKLFKVKEVKSNQNVSEQDVDIEFEDTDQKERDILESMSVAEANARFRGSIMFKESGPGKK